MAQFIDPSAFRNEDELFAYILEHVVKPKLREALGTDDPMDQISGVVYVFGGHGGIDPGIFARLQRQIQSGVNLEYALREMCDLKVRSTRESQVGQLQVRYIEMCENDDGVETPSAKDLAAMYLRE